MQKPRATVTAEMLWINHRASLGGENAKSAATGAPINLPYLLEQAPVGVQGSHWGMACVVAIVNGTENPPAPPGVTKEEQERILWALDIKQTC